jgi:hypothetical protein
MIIIQPLSCLLRGIAYAIKKVSRTHIILLWICEVNSVSDACMTIYCMPWRIQVCDSNSVWDNITHRYCDITVPVVLYILFTVRIASSGPIFRGFAIQARESTPSFSSTAEFVGEFVNPPAVGDWRIWNCGAVRKIGLNIIVTLIPQKLETCRFLK